MSKDTVIISEQQKIDDLNQLAWHDRISNSEKAFEYSQQSVKLSRDINYPKGLAQGLRSLGFAYVRLSKNEEAAPLLKESLSLFQFLNDLEGQAIIYEYLGIVERNWGNLGGSLEFLLKGNSLIPSTSPLEIEVASCYQIGVTYKHLGNHQNALDYLYRSLSLAQKINLTLMVAYATNIIGSIYFDNGEYKKALDCYQQGLIIRRESNDKWGEAGSLDNIGFAYLKLNELDKAIDHCKQSLAISQTTNDKKGEANALLHLAEIFDKAGDITQASKFSNQSFEIRKARGDKRGEAEVLLFLAGLHKDRGDVTNDRILEWLSGALKIAEEIKAADLLSKSRFHLYEYYKRKGDYEEALKNLDLHTSLEKEFHKNTINQKISNLEISHKAEIITQRNKELTDLNEKIEKANEELKIEASLERVRTVAMSMRKPDDLLNICEKLFSELQALRFVDLRNTIINIYNEEQGSFLSYDCFGGGETGISTSYYDSHPVIEKVTRQIRGTRDAFVEIILAGKELEDWKNFRKKNGEISDAKLQNATTLYYYFYSVGTGALGISTLSPIVPEYLQILKRFKNVFELSYRRYADIEKAERQAREAQIEAALERVRAKSMAMHHSDDLITVINVVKEQLKQLGFHFHAANFVTDYSEKGYTMWLASPEESFPFKIYVPAIEQKLFQSVNDAVDRGQDFATYTLSFEEKNIYFRNLFDNSAAQNTSERAKKLVYEAKGMAASVALLSKVRLNLMNLDLVPYTDEENAIIKRFAYVFEQSYTRFLDLQKAEAQAKEAQTEVALERIRARAMAMHSSNELMDVAHILREQMGMLDQPDLETSVVNLFDEDSDFIHSWHAFREPGSSSGKTIHGTLSFRKDSSALTREMIGLYHSGKKEYTLEATGEKLNEFIQVLVNAQPDISNYIGKHPPEKVYYHFATFTGGALLTVSYQPTTEDIKSLQRRAASVFDMAYRRYLDLKKAEAQTREVQIEIAVERVRAKALAMHKSEEILSVVAVLRNELLGLNIPGVSGTTIYLKQDDGSIRMWDLTSVIELEDGFHLTLDIVFLLEKTHPELYIRKLWNSTERYSIQIQNRNDLMRTVEWLGEYKKEEAENVKRFIETSDLQSLFHSTVPLANGKLSVDLMEPPPAEMEPILQKMATAFDLAYKRFLDLQKAEAQAREAQIEAALERVRAKVMAMTNSKDLNETSLVFGEQLRKLGIDWQFSYFWLIDEAKQDTTFWITWPDYKTSLTGYTMAEAAEYFNDCLVAWRGGVKIHDNYVPPEGVQEWLDTFQRIADDAGGVAKEIMVSSTFPTGVYYYDAMMKYGSFGICISKPATDEEKKIQCRFAIEFERAYTRFLDLKQAEAQTRESQIELGLERVRARAMAMQNSDELKELIGTVNTELTKLDLILDRCIIMIYDTKSMGVTWWMSNPEAPLKPIGLFVKYHEQPPYLAFIKAWKERNLKWQYVLEGEIKKTWDKFLFVETELSQLPDFVIANMRANNRVFLNASFNSFGCLTIATLEPLPDEHFDIMLRFAKVFDLTYTRFNDLKQAEAQAREAKIEAALERVRAKAMAMHKSEDLNPAVATVFEELDKLNIGILRCGIAIMDKEKPRGDVWITVKSEQSNTIQVSGDESLDYHPLLRGAYEGWLKQEDFSYVLQGEDLISYYRDVASIKYQLPVSSSFDTEKKDQQQYYYNSVFQDGSLFAFMETAITDEAQTVIKRFANVFNLTYKRFLDLQKAEAQTREAKIEAALERVRARALAMQEPEELKDVAQVLRTEMGLLGVEELETCSIYINDEATNITECWYALKDLREEEKKLVSDHFPLNLNDTWVGREMKIFYGSDAKQVSIVMQGANRKEWINYCEERSVPFRGYYGDVIPDRTYHLYKFSHGAIGAAAAGDISAESWKLLNRAASVFSLAYSRFKDLTQARNDLIQLKEEKKRAEDALTELQSTQKQLIQAEKMASLGELTAGIAHEIQNPLNFVNNFSDVSHELLEEMKSELATGNTQSAIEIAKDVKDNLEKILHHGKRADAIVKGMLQHSRTSSGQKELTDINTLAEEYLRLAYHGLRAKDKFFNAKFETAFDPSVDKINIVPQEIGRVILNLINNSFYAVNEKKKSIGNGYEPIVTVSTKSVKPPPGGGDLGVVEIKVKDNGNGIPQKVLDKIFQPFFTTKPTGQGTGLGLSLSYDIVTKGHDGEIKVETKEGEGSAFIISLPMK